MDAPRNTARERREGSSCHVSISPRNAYPIGETSLPGFGDMNASVKKRPLAGGTRSSSRPRSGVQTRVRVLESADVMDTLSKTTSRVKAVVLDPWYNKGVGGHRDDYNEWLRDVIASAARRAEHIFVWGFPEILAYQVTTIPDNFKLLSWLTWYYKNCPTVIRGWRSAQNACLHLIAEGAETHPEHFLNPAQLTRWRSGKMRFLPGPPSVIEAPLNIGFVGKEEQTGHPAQKPLAVIEPLILMATKEEDVVLDPMCGSGTTGEACLRLNRRAILCDESEEWLAVTRDRVQKCRNGVGSHEGA